MKAIRPRRKYTCEWEGKEQELTQALMCFYEVLTYIRGYFQTIAQ